MDILINNAGEQHEVAGIEDLEPANVEKIFRTNIFGFFYLTKAALPHLQAGASVINSTSIQAYDPSPHLMHYACTKAAILNFTRSLAKELGEKNPGQRGRARPDLDAADPGDFQAKRIENFWRKDFVQASRPERFFEIVSNNIQTVSKNATTDSF